MKLNYLSTRAAGYLSMLRILLTPPSPSSPISPLGGLSKVHVRASVEGRLYQRWYPAGPGLVHRLVWNKTDVYGQEVWGLTHATGRYSRKHNRPYSKMPWYFNWSTLMSLKKNGSKRTKEGLQHLNPFKQSALITVPQSNITRQIYHRPSAPTSRGY